MNPRDALNIHGGAAWSEAAAARYGLGAEPEPWILDEVDFSFLPDPKGEMTFTPEEDVEIASRVQAHARTQTHASPAAGGMKRWLILGAAAIAVGAIVFSSRR